MYEGPQALGPLPPVEAWEGVNIPAAARHAALRVRLLPEQKVSPARGWGEAGTHGGKSSWHTVLPGVGRMTQMGSWGTGVGGSVAAVISGVSALVSRTFGSLLH